MKIDMPVFIFVFMSYFIGVTLSKKCSQAGAWEKRYKWRGLVIEEGCLWASVSNLLHTMLCLKLSCFSDYWMVSSMVSAERSTASLSEVSKTFEKPREI